MPSRKVLANAIRMLSIDAVQKALSGHPGMPMGMADIAEVLWNDYLKHNPKDPNWIDRDRFILSNGHGSMLLYAVLHLSGYDLLLEDLKQFRQLHSKTPGHPEHELTPGVETTTGPLGQGLANAVGMAIAEKQLAHTFNRPGHRIIDHYTYAFVGDGCLMEGLSHEVSSLAGTLKLGKLIVFWDDNGISIDGKVEDWWQEDTPKRFEAYGWHVACINGHDTKDICAAIEAAQAQTTQPSLICCKTTIGYGSPSLAGHEQSHGAPLGEEEIIAVRKHLKWPHDPFVIPQPVYEAWDAREIGQKRQHHWQECFKAYKADYPDLALNFERRMSGHLPKKILTAIYPQLIEEIRKMNQPLATRKASLKCLNALGAQIPELIGGSADLSGSNGTAWKGCTPLKPNTNSPSNYIHYGVREFGMFGIMNGLALHKGFIPYGGTFLVFTDYGRNAIRLAALMQQKVIFVLSHDSIGLGQDGPTHQPIEHITMLRITPGLTVWRPCDALETAIAWKSAITTKGPSCLLLTRQSVATQTQALADASVIERGGYILMETSKTEAYHTGNPEANEPDAIVIATGSEIGLAVEAAKQLGKLGHHIRVVSMPCCEIFLSQPAAYREHVLPKTVLSRVAIEAGSSNYWYQFVGLSGYVLGLDSFGLSAPGKTVFQEKGFTVEQVIKTTLSVIGKEITQQA